MRFILTFIVILFLFFVIGSLAQPPQLPLGDYVVELTNSTFKTLVQGRASAGIKGFYLVEFYSPYCGHCRAFAPAYEQVGDFLRGIIPVGRLSAPDYRELAQEYEVKGVPHVALFIPGEVKPIVYSDEKTPEAIVDWVQENLVDRGFDSLSLLQNDVDAFVNVEKDIYPSRYLLLYSQLLPENLVEIIAQLKDKYFFAKLNLASVASSESALSRFGIKSVPALVAHGQKQHLNTGQKATLEVVQGVEFDNKIRLMFVEVLLKSKEEMAEEIARGQSRPSFLSSLTSGLYLMIIAAACLSAVAWFYRNRNRKVRHVVPAVDLNSVSWDVGGKKNID